MLQRATKVRYQMSDCSFTSRRGREVVTKLLESVSSEQEKSSNFEAGANQASLGRASPAATPQAQTAPIKHIWCLEVPGRSLACAASRHLDVLTHFRLIYCLKSTFCSSAIIVMRVQLRYESEHQCSMVLSSEEVTISVWIGERRMVFEKCASTTISGMKELGDSQPTRTLRTPTSISLFSLSTSLSTTAHVFLLLLRLLVGPACRSYRKPRFSLSLPSLARNLKPRCTCSASV